MPSSIPCKHCGTAIPFEELDRGFEVYCKSCGRANAVPRAEPPGGATGPEPSAREATPPVPPIESARSSRPAQRPVLFSPRSRKPRTGRRFHPLWIPLLAALIGVCLWTATQVPEDVLRRLVNPHWADDVLESDESGEGLSEGGDTAPETPFEPVPDPEVTLTRIEQLLDRSDRREALVQAQVWEELLRDQGAADGDARHARLQGIIVRLKAEIAPSDAEIAKRLGEFDQALRTTGEALSSSDAARARNSWDQAWGLFRNRSEELAFGARRLLTLKVRLQTQEAMVGGAGGIERCFEQAGKALDSGEPLEAAREEARARFLARITPGLSEADAQRLHALARRTASRLQLARGKRAAAEAREADRLRDPATRDRQAFRAFSLLAGMPEEEIRPVLDGLGPWNQRALQSGGPQGLPGPSSPLGREIQRRDAYESVLERYAEADAPKLVAAFREFAVAEPSRSSAQAHRSKGYVPAEQFVFDVLERETIARLAPLSGHATEDLRPALVALGDVLDQASTAEPHERWRLLDAVLRCESDALARQRLESAIALARRDQLEEAVEGAKWAGRFGGPEARRQAEQLQGVWQAELHLRSRPAVLENAWRRLEALHAKEDRLLEFVREARRFLQRHPRSPHGRVVREWLTAAEPEMPAQITAAIDQTASLLDQQDWSGAWARFALLRSAPIPPPAASAFQELTARFDQVKAEAQREFLLLDEARPLTEESHVVMLLEGLPLVLAKDPEHAEARRLWELARRQGRLRAEKLLNAALSLRAAKPEACRKRLQRAIQLDAMGPCGKKAEALLDELGGRFAAPVDSSIMRSLDGGTRGGRLPAVVSVDAAGGGGFALSDARNPGGAA